MKYLKVMSVIILMASACLFLSCGGLRHSGEKRPQMKADNGKRIEASQIVDLGLKSGTLWAGWNIGAESPEGCGGYYSWGETIDKEVYNWEHYFDLIGQDGDKRVFESFQPNGNRTIVGNPEADVATAVWGSHWTMPSKDQIDELLRDCKWTWTSLKGQRGFVVRGPNKRRIFLPAAGCYFENLGPSSISQFDKTCFYWCGELDERYTSRAYCLIMLENYPKYYDRNGERCDGKPVRAVYRP